MADQETNAEETTERRIEFNFPLLMVRTKIFGGFFDKFGSFRASKYLSWISLIVVPIVAAIGLYLISSSLVTMLWTPALREIQRALGPASLVLLPGINPMIPIFYGWLGLVCTIVIHEGAHGIVARNRGLNVKSSGLVFFLIIPFGAFVDVDEEQIANSKPKDSLRVMAAGVGANIAVSLACIIVVLIIVNGLTPIVNGVYVSEIITGMPAESAGLLPGDVFLSVDGQFIDRYKTLNLTLLTKNPGDVIKVTVLRGEKWENEFSTSITLTESDDGKERAIMGISRPVDLLTEERLNFYKTVTPETLSVYLVPPSFSPGLVPFSDSLSSFYTHDLGKDWSVWANVFFWLWFINVNVAVFNALPIYPLDGGRMFDISLKSILGKRMNEKTISKITYTVTLSLVGILLMIFVIPFIF